LLDKDREVKEVDKMKESLNHYLDYFEKCYVGRPGRAGCG